MSTFRARISTRIKIDRNLHCGGVMFRNYMISTTRFVWTIWTSMSAVLKKAVKLNHSLTPLCEFLCLYSDIFHWMNLLGSIWIQRCFTAIGIPVIKTIKFSKGSPKHTNDLILLAQSLKIFLILLPMWDHLLFKTTMRGGHYREVWLYLNRLTSRGLNY